MGLDSALWTNTVSACIPQEHVEDLPEGFQQEELLAIRGRRTLVSRSQTPFRRGLPGEMGSGVRPLMSLCAA